MTVRVACPGCGSDVVCAVRDVMVFKADSDESRMMVMFPCPTCLRSQVRGADSRYMDRLIMAGAHLADSPDEMRDPVRYVEIPLTLDEVLDLLVELALASDVVEAVCGEGAS